MAQRLHKYERMDRGASGLTVVCVCVPGGTYDTTHVVRLMEMVRTNLSKPADFEILKESDLPGWWAKVGIFLPGHFSGRVLYLDLDVTITGSLDDLVNIDAPFAIIDEWQRPGQMYNSSVMVWDAGVADHIYTNFTPEVMDRYHGDQGWIHEQMPDAATFPKRWCKSYKKHIRPRLNDSIPEDCRVVCYHGQPKPWDLEESYAEAQG